MRKYHAEISGTFDYDMMPRVHKVILVGKGHIEDYEITLDDFDINIKKVTLLECECDCALLEGVPGDPLYARCVQCKTLFKRSSPDSQDWQPVIIDLEAEDDESE